MSPAFYGGTANFNQSKYVVRFPNGSNLFFGHCQHPGDEVQYNGTEWAFIGIDELTEWDYKMWAYLTAAGMTTEMTKKAAELATKADNDMNDVFSKANTIKTSIQAAKDGNELAASIAPLQTTLFITTSEGVKRINETELKGVSGAGSLVQELNGWFSKKASGDPIPPKIKDDMVQLMDLYTKSAAQKYQRHFELDQSTPWH